MKCLDGSIIGTNLGESVIHFQRCKTCLYTPNLDVTDRPRQRSNSPCFQSPGILSYFLSLIRLSCSITAVAAAYSFPRSFLASFRWLLLHKSPISRRWSVASTNGRGPGGRFISPTEDLATEAVARQGERGYRGNAMQ